MKAETIETTADRLQLGDVIVEWNGAKWTGSTVLSINVRQGATRRDGTSYVRQPDAIKVTLRSGNRGGLHVLSADDEVVVRRTPITV